jgi:hypothetical protein
LQLESLAVLKDRSTKKTVEELKDAGTLPKERLEQAPAYVNMSTHPMAGLTVPVPVHVDWDETRKIWTWNVAWRNLLSRFFEAKERQGKRWPTTAFEASVPRGSLIR